MATVNFFRNSDEDDGFSVDRLYPFAEELVEDEDEELQVGFFALIQLEKSVFALPGSILIGSRLDADINENVCRLVFSGELLCEGPQPLDRLQVFKERQKTGCIDRIVDKFVVIGKDMFGKGSDLSMYVGHEVVSESGNKGKIEGAFGKSGKFKVRFESQVSDPPSSALILTFKRFVVL